MARELLTADEVFEFLSKLSLATEKKRIAWTEQDDAPVSVLGDGYRVGLRKDTKTDNGLPDYTVTLYHRERLVKEFGYADARQHENRLKELVSHVVESQSGNPIFGIERWTARTATPGTSLSRPSCSRSCSTGK